MKTTAISAKSALDTNAASGQRRVSDSAWYSAVRVSISAKRITMITAPP